MLIVWQWKSNYFFPMKEGNSSPGFFIQEQNSLGYDSGGLRCYLFVVILSVRLSEGN